MNFNSFITLVVLTFTSVLNINCGGDGGPAPKNANPAVQAALDKSKITGTYTAKSDCSSKALDAGTTISIVISNTTVTGNANATKAKDDKPCNFRVTGNIIDADETSVKVNSLVVTKNGDGCGEPAKALDPKDEETASVLLRKDGSYKVEFFGACFIANKS